MQPSDRDALAPAGWSERLDGEDREFSTLPGLLIAASITLDLALFALHTPRTNGPTLTGMVYLALAFSQISLVTIWASLAATHALLRCLVFASVVCALMAALVRFEPPGSGWLLLVGIQILALCTPLFLLRRSGTRFDVPRSGDREEKSEHHQVQFSLRHIFLATTTIAVLLGVLRGSDFPGHNVAIFCSMGLLFAAIGWISTWSVFGPHNWRHRLAVLLVFGPLAGGFIAGIIRGQITFMLWHAVLNLAQSLLLAGSLVVLRTAGFRLRARRRPIKEATL